MIVAELWKWRQTEADRFFECSDLNGYQIVDADGWEHTNSNNDLYRKIHVENDDSVGPTVSKTLTVTFSSHSAKIIQATIDGVEVAGSSTQKRNQSLADNFLRLRLRDPEATKKVRINLSAMTRAEWSCSITVPKNISDDKLQELVRHFYDSVDAGEFTEDNEYWEKGDCYVEDL